MQLPNAEVANLIAGNLHALPHPERGQLRLPWFAHMAPHLAQYGDETREKIHAHAQAIGTAITHLIEQSGKTIIDNAELKRLRAIEANQQPAPHIAHAYCQHCGVEIIRLALDDQLCTHLHRIALETIGSPHNCWS